MEKWSLQGKWQAHKEKLILAAPGRKITFRFHARDLHLVLPVGSRVSYRTELRSGKQIDLDQFFIEWYWVNSSLNDTQQPRAVGGAVGPSWDHTWTDSGLYKIYAMISQFGADGKSYIPMGALRAEASIVPQMTGEVKVEKYSTGSNKPRVTVFHFDTDERTTDLDFETDIRDVGRGKFICDLTVKGLNGGKFKISSPVKTEPISAFREAVNLWRRDQVSKRPQCTFPEGGIEMFAHVGNEAELLNREGRYRSRPRPSCAAVSPQAARTSCISYFANQDNQGATEDSAAHI